ncbi:MAG: homoaconitate hydratase family protein [Chloroflexi bacterium]|jgi:homoaconitate hydratase family protein|uniref:3-isopropylmalate dehydratase large subunit n=2 Tax=Candidatus Thermofonsia Clade 3 TaxID=2364209 RepID=A0A2M8QAL8_9CHLR|nr:MAG: 3-isopropylmalate dehydratase large subunit [Candidatus Thermofonsia Clade 3 bacterium]RMG65453.1 MAG: homoaconitate hydratase family protein [Chloroflexota bacterium]
MGKTFAEKALARASGQSETTAGQIVDARPDRVLSHDNTAAIYRLFRQLGVERVKHPERLCITLDHAVPAPTTQHAQNHAEVRRFVREQGVRHFFEVGRGICHQVFSEEALVLPGMTILGSDSHTTHFGWLGAFGAGIGRSEVAALWATGELWLRVPESMKVVVTGSLPPWVTTKDFCLKLIGDLGQDGGLYRSVEFHGDGIGRLSLESRMVIPNMMAEFGAKNAYLPPDEAVFSYLEERLQRRLRAAEAQQDTVECAAIESQLAGLRSNALYPDAEAAYVFECRYELGALEPMVARPHRVDNVAPISEVKGRPVQQAWLGTCTNGRLEDIAAACDVLRGRRVARTTRLLWNPASSEVLQAALQLGYVATFLEAGGVISAPGCGPCMGNHMGVPAVGEVTISSANRNFRGRMGTRESEIYLASPAVVAASAVAGVIADPREIVG